MLGGGRTMQPSASRFHGTRGIQFHGGFIPMYPGIYTYHFLNFSIWMQCLFHLSMNLKLVNSLMLPARILRSRNSSTRLQSIELCSRISGERRASLPWRMMMSPMMLPPHPVPLLQDQVMLVLLNITLKALRIRVQVLSRPRWLKWVLVRKRFR